MDSIKFYSFSLLSFLCSFISVNGSGLESGEKSGGRTHIDMGDSQSQNVMEVDQVKTVELTVKDENRVGVVESSTEVVDQTNLKDHVSFYPSLCCCCNPCYYNVSFFSEWYRKHGGGIPWFAEKRTGYGNCVSHFLPTARILSSFAIAVYGIHEMIVVEREYEHRDSLILLTLGSSYLCAESINGIVDNKTQQNFLTKNKKSACCWGFLQLSSSVCALLGTGGVFLYNVLRGAFDHTNKYDMVSIILFCIVLLGQELTNFFEGVISMREGENWCYGFWKPCCGCCRCYRK